MFLWFVTLISIPLIVKRTRCSFSLPQHAVQSTNPSPSNTMGDKFHPPQSNPDPEYPGHTSGIQENESAPFIYDNLIPEYTQPPPFRHLTNTKPIPSTDDRLIPNPERSLNPKVPIPRSAYPRNFIVSRRVSKACENCREQKAKCTGNRPTCQRCQDAGIRCFYGDGKGEKMLKCV